MTSFDEKPLLNHFIGYMVFNRKIFDYIRNTSPGLDNEIYLSDALNNSVKDGIKIIAVPNTDYYMDIGIVDRYLSVNRRFYENSKD